MLRLTRRFDLDLIDVEARSERDLVKTFHFGGVSRTEDEVVEAFRPLAGAIAQDQRDLVLNDYTDYNQRAFDLDHTALSTYLTQIGATGFIRDLLDVAYLTEYGCETDQQSALNLVFLIGTKMNHGFQEFGPSDQRYKVVGGNGRITSAIADDLDRPVKLGHRLVAVQPDGDAFTCTFETASGIHDVTTDILLLTLPFAVLRHIDLDVPLPGVVRQYIDECGYGTNSKLVLGFDRRYWRDAAQNGLFFTDLALQSGWDSSQLQPGHRGSLTVYTGGDQGVAIGQGTVGDQRDLSLPMLEQLFPGATARHNDRAFRFVWPEHEWSKGSYTCFSPGQYTAFTGSAAPVGNLFFAGEHVSFDFQGYMEGGAVTGKEAARQIAQLI
ncbi:MAG: flavin monoamine oxidase family protein [Dehalococcoidia bacterium]